MKLSRDQIKYLAMAAMALNHISQMFRPPNLYLQYFMIDIGYMTAPLMCWFLVRGFYATRSKMRYGRNLLLFAVLSQPFYGMWYMLCGGSFSLNMLFTLSVCFLILLVRNSKLSMAMKLFLQVFFVLMTGFMTWPVVAAVMMVLFDMSRQFGIRLPVYRRLGDFMMFGASGLLVLFAHAYGLGPFWSPVVTWKIPYVTPASFAILLAGVLALLAYDPGLDNPERRGWVQKYFFYAFYPIHLGLICAVRILMG